MANRGKIEAHRGCYNMAYVKKSSYITIHKETVQKRRKKYKLCKTCKYRTTRTNELDNGMLCNYIGITGKMRGCKAECCIRYEKGNTRNKKHHCINYQNKSTTKQNKEV